MNEFIFVAGPACRKGRERESNLKGNKRKIQYEVLIKEDEWGQITCKGRL
jgi:hypothetical protein